MKFVLLLRDIEDVYKLGDGICIFRNVKFEMMCVDVVNYFKYKLWLWRFLVYECVFLLLCEVFEYKWNCFLNIYGGLGKNIFNDNFVEICVYVIKKKCGNKVLILFMKVLRRLYYVCKCRKKYGLVFSSNLV